jgi:hypothetical protein
MRYALPLFAIALLTGCTTAHPAPVSTKLGIIEPYKGVYYDPQQSGSGLEVDLGPNGRMFMTFETYDQAGSQVNLITQPTYMPSAETDLQSSIMDSRWTIAGNAWRSCTRNARFETDRSDPGIFRVAMSLPDRLSA